MAHQHATIDDGRDDQERLALRPRHVELLDQLEAMFFAQGYRALTMDMIAQQLRCSKRALYEIAPNRKALFLSVIARWAARIQAMGDAAADRGLDSKAKLAAYLEPGVTQSRGMTEAFLSDLADHADARRAFEAHQQVRMARLRDIVDEGIRAGEFADVHAKLVAGICLAAIERINQPRFLSEVGLSFADAFAELYRVLLHGLTQA